MGPGKRGGAPSIGYPRPCSAHFPSPLTLAPPWLLGNPWWVELVVLLIPEKLSSAAQCLECYSRKLSKSNWAGGQVEADIRPLLLLPSPEPGLRVQSPGGKATGQGWKDPRESGPTFGTPADTQKPTAHSPQPSLDCLGRSVPTGQRIRRPEFQAFPPPYQFCDLRQF